MQPKCITYKVPTEYETEYRWPCIALFGVPSFNTLGHHAAQGTVKTLICAIIVLTQLRHTSRSSKCNAQKLICWFYRKRSIALV